MNPLIQLKTTPPLLIILTLLCFALLPKAEAVVPPAEGQNALFSLTTGQANTALGWFSLKSLTTGGFNTAVGAGTLVLNTGDENTATGTGALFSNTTGSQNTANGASALLDNSTGDGNTAVGTAALALNTSGSRNVAIGSEALTSNEGGFGNVAIGENALSRNVNGFQNIAVGFATGQNIIKGVDNIYIGIGVPEQGTDDESQIIRIGHPTLNLLCFIAGIYSRPPGPDQLPVLVGSNGRLGTLVSSRRFKHDIKPMDNASEAILALKPVTFRYNSDATNTPSFGLIAEEVAEVNPNLVVRDKEGKPLSVRYEDVNAMLLNEFLKARCTVQELKSTVAKQEATILQQKKDFQAIASQQQKQIEALTTGLQKVSAQLEASKLAPQVVSNP
jgi:Chaperone of endosialidase